MRKEKKIRDKSLRVYLKPTITCIYIQIENCISAGSANIILPNERGELLEEWDVGENRNESFDW